MAFGLTRARKNAGRRSYGSPVQMVTLPAREGDHTEGGNRKQCFQGVEAADSDRDLLSP